MSSFDQSEISILMILRHDESLAQASANLMNDWMEHFQRQFPSGQHLSSSQRRYRFQSNNMMRQPTQAWLNEDPYLERRNFCYNFSNPESTQIQLWQFLLVSRREQKRSRTKSRFCSLLFLNVREALRS